MTFCKNLISLSILFVLPGTASALDRSGSLSNPPSPALATSFQETLCDTTLADPYRYMEKPRAPEVLKWMKEQSAFARKVLDGIPGRKELLKKMQEFDGRKSAKIYNLAITDNDRYFYLKQTPGDETGKLCCRDGYNGKETLLFDPGVYSGDRKGSYVIGTIAPSDDGSKVAFTVYPNGSENASLLIMETGTVRLYPETISRCRFASPSWTPDGSAFLYNRLEAPSKKENSPQYASKTWLHKAGTDVFRQISREFLR